MKDNTDIIASSAASLIGEAAILVIMYVETFKLLLLFLLSTS
jgi:hypothetical protein